MQEVTSLSEDIEQNYGSFYFTDKQGTVKIKYVIIPRTKRLQ